MPEAVATIEGWYALHDFRRVDWERWHATPKDIRAALLEDLVQWTTAWEQKNQGRQAGFGSYQMLGHKADLLFLYFAPRLEDLAEAEAHFRSAAWAGLLAPVWSYLSVVELSQYLAKGESAENSPYLQGRLYPSVPQTRYLVFYPMSKRRQANDNWYMLSADERRELMQDHGLIGHRHRSQVTQIITGSQGLDDWEWGVTLFADDAVAFKKIVYEMRFDEATARFGEFGPFYTGIRLDSGAVEHWFVPPAMI